MSVKEDLLAWMDKFPNNHYVLDVYGETVTVDLPKEIVIKLIDISILLVDRVVDAKDELRTAEYEDMEARVRKEYSEDGAWLLHVIMKAVSDDHLFGRYRDVEPMIGELMPRGYPMESAAYLLMVRPEIHKLIYAVIRHVDDVKENYNSLVYTFWSAYSQRGGAKASDGLRLKKETGYGKAGEIDAKAKKNLQNENSERRGFRIVLQLPDQTVSLGL